MAQSLSGRVALITGATSGFGAAMAACFAAEGAALVLVARQRDRLEETCARLSTPETPALAVVGDVTQRATFETALAVALERWGKLDILINNAGGGGLIAPIEAQTPETVADCLNLNLASVINGCSVVAPVMTRQRAGLIINVTSACEQFAWPGWSVYSAAKAGVAMFSRCLYTELRPHGVAVTVLAPGGANTGFQRTAGIESFDWDDGDSLRAEHIAHAALAVATMPHGAVVPHLVAYGMSQEIVPF